VSAPTTKPRIAVFKLSSCDGCQLQLLDAEEALLQLAGAVDIVYFREARSHEEPGPYDITLVEGSIADPDLLNSAFDEHKPEVVVHAAASYKDPDNWYGDALTNVVGTANVVRASDTAWRRKADLPSDRPGLRPASAGAADHASITRCSRVARATRSARRQGRSTYS